MAIDKIDRLIMLTGTVIEIERMLITKERQARAEVIAKIKRRLNLPTGDNFNGNTYTAGDINKVIDKIEAEADK